MEDTGKIPKFRLIDAKMESKLGAVGKLIRAAKISQEDVGKFYVLSADKKSGQIMSHDEMFALEVDEIGGWYRIGEFDVDC